MLALVARLRETVDLADIHRLVPKRFWLDERTTDRYERGAFILKDYAGRPVRVSLPIAINRIPQIGFETPIVLAPGNLLGQAHPPLIFVVRSSGEFSRYWAGYPRRRMIPPPDQSPSNEDSTGIEEVMPSSEKIIEE